MALGGDWHRTPNKHRTQNTEHQRTMTENKGPTPDVSQATDPLHIVAQSLTSRQLDMLTALELTRGNVVQACIAAEVPHRTHYHWMDHVPEYAAGVRLVDRVILARLEAEADRRAIEGLQRLRFYKGQPIINPETGQPYEEREYSDTLLMFRARALAPEKYKDRSDVTVSNDEVERLLAELAVLRAERVRLENPGNDRPGIGDGGSSPVETVGGTGSEGGDGTDGGGASPF
jgi:hypothetical protein